MPYNCSIKSNGETVHLIWRVTVPGYAPVNTTYNGTFDGVTNLNPYITTTLDFFESDAYISSTLKIVLQADIVIDQTLVECFINGLGNSSLITFINTSGIQLWSKKLPSSNPTMVILPVALCLFFKVAGYPSVNDFVNISGMESTLELNIIL